MVYAGFWKRYAAVIIDALILTPPAYAIGYIYAMILIYYFEIHDLYILEDLGNLLGIIIAWVYRAVMESSQLQATVGKLAFNIKVTDLNGERISFGHKHQAVISQ